MVNMVKPDVPGEPLQYFGQFVIGASFQSSFGKIPVIFAQYVSLN